MITPIFAIHYLRALMPTFFDVSYQLKDALASEIDKQSTLNIMGLLSRTTLEALARAGLGHSFGDLRDNSNVYVEAAKELTYANITILIHQADSYYRLQSDRLWMRFGFFFLFFHTL
jgi:hypothetical protein